MLVPTFSAEPNQTSQQILEINFDANHVRKYTWRNSDGAGAIVLFNFQPLAHEATYELHIPPNAIEDVAGNSWQGGELHFKTNCAPSGCRTDSVPAPSPT